MSHASLEKRLHVRESVGHWSAGTVETLAGACAGAAAGILAGPPGIAIGAACGAIVGLLAAFHVERFAHEEAMHDKELDRIGEERWRGRPAPYSIRSWA